jgi:hypothetical protein
MSDTSYSNEKKKKIASKISEMRNKDDLRKIRNMIFEENPEIAVNKDSGGMLMFCQNWKLSTFVRLEKFIKDIEHKKLSKQAESITKTSEQLSVFSDDQPVNYLTDRTRFRYSNKEKSIIRRKAYENEMNRPGESSENFSEMVSETDEVNQQKDIKKVQSTGNLKTISNSTNEPVYVSNKRSSGTKRVIDSDILNSFDVASVESDESDELDEFDKKPVENIKTKAIGIVKPMKKTVGKKTVVKSKSETGEDFDEQVENVKKTIRQTNSTKKSTIFSKNI